MAKKRKRPEVPLNSKNAFNIPDPTPAKAVKNMLYRPKIEVIVGGQR